MAEHLLCTQMEWGDRDAIELTTRHPSPLLLLLFNRIAGGEKTSAEVAAEDATETKVPGDAAKFPLGDWVRSVL